METRLLNLIPDDLLNLIWQHVRPNIKYKLNKKMFNKYYYYRFALINTRYIFYNKIISIYNSYIIRNYNYIKYLLIYDNKFVFENIIYHKIYYESIKYIYTVNIKFENKIFNNFLDFCFYYIKRYNSIKITNYLNEIIKKYKLVDFVKKEHKNNNKLLNKLNKWKI